MTDVARESCLMDTKSENNWVISTFQHKQSIKQGVALYKKLKTVLRKSFITKLFSFFVANQMSRNLINQLNTSDMN